jgi:hypothetical protein
LPLEDLTVLARSIARRSTQGITYRDAHIVLDHADRFGISPEAAYGALVELVATSRRGSASSQHDDGGKKSGDSLILRTGRRYQAIPRPPGERLAAATRRRSGARS